MEPTILGLHRQFQQAIIENPQDRANKLVYADWLDEQGWPTQAAVWRWLGRTGRHPHGGDGSWKWYGPEDIERHGAQHCLPGPLWRSVLWRNGGRYSCYEHDLTGIIAAVAKAWGRVGTGFLWLTPWVPDETPVRWMSPEECRFLTATRGVR